MLGDVVIFDKGSMYIGKEEEVCFKRGNIDEWDFLLMIFVLLFFIKCVLEISRRFGYDIVFYELKKCCNKLLGYFFIDRMFDVDFNYYWFLLLKNFIIFGVDFYVIVVFKFKLGN